tara:strand:- start:23526 stop:25955 length:2430 start_codon:yes stop_codon:yes gene_type:complete
MKVSYNWLKTYLSINLPAVQVAEVLTDIGLEIEGVDEVEAMPGGLKGLVIGEILSVAKHANADKLNVTEVNIGTDENLPIVCGAPNVSVGQKVVVATVNAILYPADGDPFKIKKAKIRGEVSIGMICAEDEIGLGEGHDGIMVLPNDTVVGTPASEYFKVESDYVFEIGLTPNRADAMSHYGVARDLAVGLKQQNLLNNDVVVTITETNFKVDNTSKTLKVNVASVEACSRYCGVSISGITVQESPDWLKNRLRSIGLKPVNNVVDATNFILHDMGQPLHAFDADQIKGDEVNVKMLAQNTPFVTLDEVERKLNEKDLMICNAEEGMCIAGVFGGVHSGVTNKTTSIFLESAYFNPVFVRKTAKRLGLNTDASFRFERGIDPNITMVALKRAAMLIKELTGGEISSEVSDTNPTQVENFEVPFNVERACAVIGKVIPTEEIKNILAQLEIKIKSEAGAEWLLNVPPYRNDTTREADVIEDILRIYGYNKIAIPEKLVGSVSYSTGLDHPTLKNSMANLLVGMGYNESMSNSLASKEVVSKIKGFDVEQFVDVENPLSNELNMMRPNLMYHALEVVKYNANRKQPDLRLFEMGKSYLKGDEKYIETELMSFTITGNIYSESWIGKETPINLAYARSVVDAILKRYKVEVNISELNHPAYEYGLNFNMGNKVLAYVGKVSDETLNHFDVSEPVYFGEINRDILLKKARKNKVSVIELPKYPQVRRDLALLINNDVQFDSLKENIKKSERKLLQEVDLFDVYQGKNLPEGKKSYAVKIILQDAKETLTDKRVDKVMDKIISSLKAEFNAELR